MQQRTWLFLLSVCFPLAGLLAADADAQRSVVQVITFQQAPVWDAPWRFRTVQQVTGSGFYIGNRRIMTNAHVVSWNREIALRRYNTAQPYTARVQFVGHDCDLAVLEVSDPSFFEGLKPLEMGPLPKVRSTVLTYGYPAGGDQISYTRGVVSRIDMQPYSHIGNRSFLVVQTDAAINPGNSGGPVIQDGRVVGVAFQGISGLENTGFFIPPPIIEHFLKDIADGKYDGFPDCGITLAPFQSAAYRRFLQLPQNGKGARVDNLLPIPSTQALVKVDDILMQVGPYEVGSDNTILYQGNRVNSGAAFDIAQSGEKLPLKIWREGRLIDVAVPTTVYRDDRAEGNQYDVLPRYYVQGGLVFVPLSYDYLRSCGPNWFKQVGPELVFEISFLPYEMPSKRRREPVVLASVLPHPVNADMKVRTQAMIDRINGVRIECLEDAVRAFESCKDAYHVIEFLPHHQFECLNRQDVNKANDAILKTYGIGKDRQL
jgi:S1-C subfamily serine protease